MAQNFGGRKFYQIAANKHFGRQNIGGLAILYSKVARIKFLADWSLTAISTKVLCYTIYRTCNDHVW